MDKNKLKLITKFKLNCDNLKVYCNSGSIGTHIGFPEENVGEIIDYFKEYGIKLDKCGWGASYGIYGKQDCRVDLKFPQFTSLLIEETYIILAVPDCNGAAVMARLILKN